MGQVQYSHNVFSEIAAWYCVSRWSTYLNEFLSSTMWNHTSCHSVAQFSSVQFSRSVMSDSLWPHESQHTRLPFLHYLPEFAQLMSVESLMPSSHLILCRPLLFLPPVPPSIRVFSNESTLRMRWPKYWSFSFSIIPSKETPGLISSRMDWLDLLAVQGTLKSLLQHHSSKHQFFGAQPSSQSNSHIHTWPQEKS